MAEETMDKLVVKGLGAADGAYEINLRTLIDIGSPDSLDNREQHRIKLNSGVRGGEIFDAVVALDAAVMVSLVGIILARHGKVVTDERIWNTRMVFASGAEAPSVDDYQSVVLFEIADRAESEEEVSSPPAVAPPPTEQPSPSGGASLKPISGHLGNGQSRTGLQDSGRSATSVPATSGI